MSLIRRIEEAARRAEARRDFEPDVLRGSFLGRPQANGTQEEINSRRDFLQETVGSAEGAEFLERILNGNELQSVNYLARGARASKAVARIRMVDPVENVRGWGTGFLIAPHVLITNNHVIARPEAAAASEAQFNYEQDESGTEVGPETYAFDPQRLFYTSRELDFTVVAVRGLTDQPQRYGFLPLLSTLGKALEGEWLTILQHPNGERKQVAVRENRLMKKADTVLWYSTDTVGGSSGSPVTNNDWFVVALHHSGIPLRRNGRIQTVDGQDWTDGDESRIKWLANEGIRASVIARALSAALPNHPLLLPMYNATPESARVIAPDSPAATPINKQATPTHNPSMNTCNIELPLTVEAELKADGTINVVRASLNGLNHRNGNESSSSAATRIFERDAAGFDDFTEASIEAPFDTDFKKRPGYKPGFLGQNHTVNLPSLRGMTAQAAPLIDPPDAASAGKYELKYHNYSVVMHAKRRFAIFSAANVNMGQRYRMNRTGDVWRTDPRLDPKYQIGNFYYRKNQFDRGHLTRREDLEFGATPRDALISAADTCFWTNCVPQHKRFNQNKETWQGLERHILEESIIADQLNAQVITGPVFEDDDPEYDVHPDIQYPVRFWKVVAGLKSDKTLFAVAFILDQSDVIRRYGLEEAAVPIGAFKTYQTKVSEIERLTGLEFTCNSGSIKVLRDCDPLQSGVPSRLRRRSAHLRTDESVVVNGDVPAGAYHLIESPRSVYLGG